MIWQLAIEIGIEVYPSRTAAISQCCNAASVVIVDEVSAFKLSDLRPLAVITVILRDEQDIVLGNSQTKATCLAQEAHNPMLNGAISMPRVPGTRVCSRHHATVLRSKHGHA